MKIIFTIFLFIATRSLCEGQQVSTVGKYIYNDSWELKKGDTLKLGYMVSESGFQYIYDSPTEIRERKKLDASNEGNTVEIKAIKRYVWDNEEEDVFFIIEVNDKKYYIDFLEAVANDEIVRPSGIEKQKQIILNQKDKTKYIASNGVTYKVGDFVELGRGSGFGGRFTYVTIGGWASITYGMRDPIGASYAGQKLVLKKIIYDNNRRRKYNKVYFSVGGGNITNYTVDIEPAISSCEVIPCNDVGNVKIVDYTSTADELIKLKKLKDEGVLNEEEFEQQKKKLLSK